MRIQNGAFVERLHETPTGGRDKETTSNVDWQEQQTDKGEDGVHECCEKVKEGCMKSGELETFASHLLKGIQRGNRVSDS